MENNNNLFTTGMCNWKGFSLSIQQIEVAAQQWKKALEGIELPWLCWNVDPEWCLVQQKLVKLAGWTPVVGGDPRAAAPEILDGAISIDFNKELNLPNMHFLLPIEFTWLFTKKIAFWHSDLLVRKEKFINIANKFSALKNGDMGVTIPNRSLKMKLLSQNDRYWELIGCTTSLASQSQFENGAGWFSNILHHPNCSSKEFVKRKSVYYDHGAGIKYWHKHYASSESNIIETPESYIEEGHCTRIRNKKYIPQSPNNEKRDLTKDLAHNYSLKEESARLNLQDLLD
jgi:hypothetical protein